MKISNMLVQFDGQEWWWVWRAVKGQTAGKPCWVEMEEKGVRITWLEGDDAERKTEGQIRVGEPGSVSFGA